MLTGEEYALVRWSPAQPTDTRRWLPTGRSGTTAPLRHRRFRHREFRGSKAAWASANAGTANFLLPLGLEGQRMQVWLVDSFGAQTLITSTSAGAGGSGMFNVPEDGSYVIHFATVGSDFPSFASVTKPAYMRDTYTFQVQQ